MDCSNPQPHAVSLSFVVASFGEFRLINFGADAPSFLLKEQFRNAQQQTHESADHYRQKAVEVGHVG
jgi:hypothetical protein